MKKTSKYFSDDYKANTLSLEVEFLRTLECDLGKTKITATPADAYVALASALKAQLMRKYVKINYDDYRIYNIVYDLDMSHLMGNMLISMDKYDEAYNILKGQGYSLEDVRDYGKYYKHENLINNEIESNYIETSAAVNIPMITYSLYFKSGFVLQQNLDDRKKNHDSKFLEDTKANNPFLVEINETYKVPYGGYLERAITPDNILSKWVCENEIAVKPLLLLFPGYGNNCIHIIKYWKIYEGMNDLELFGNAEYFKLYEKIIQNNILTEFQFINETTVEGRKLFFKQLFLLISASLQDIFEKSLINKKDKKKLCEKLFIKINEEYIVLATLELIRLLMEKFDVTLDSASKIAKEITFITAKDNNYISLKDEDMGIFKSYFPLHSNLLYEIFNEKEKNVKYIISNFRNDFNVKYYDREKGISMISPVRMCNPLLSGLITEKLGYGWIKNVNELKNLKKYLNDQEFHENIRGSKWLNKKMLINYIEKTEELKINPESMFSINLEPNIQFDKQLLRVFYMIFLYFSFKYENKNILPETFLFVDYRGNRNYYNWLVKKLLLNIRQVIKTDRQLNEKISISFLSPDAYQISIPGVELLEQLTATKNIQYQTKVLLANCSLALINKEKLDEPLELNFQKNNFIFSTVPIQNMKVEVNDSKNFQTILNLIKSNEFSMDEPDVFSNLILGYMVNNPEFLYELETYIEIRKNVAELYRNLEGWTIRVIENLIHLEELDVNYNIIRILSKSMLSSK